MIRKKHEKLLMSAGAVRWQRAVRSLGTALLLLVACASVFAVFFIFWFIARDAFPFFRERGLLEFLFSSVWRPSGTPAFFGALPIFVGSLYVTVGACAIAVPFGIGAAVCLSDMVPFAIRQTAKSVVEMLAAIPSVAYGFFALVVLAPLLQREGGRVPAIALTAIALPLVLLAATILGDRLTAAIPREGVRRVFRWTASLSLAGIGGWGVWLLYGRLAGVAISSGTNAFTVSVILGIMALPTIVSVSEDALQAVPREMREGSYALGATRAETLMRVVIPAASSGICAAVILGVMRALGETMVVWMAAGNSPQVPTPWYNLFTSVRTLTATIAGDMGEADQATGSMRFHVLFAMALSLLVFSFAMNGLSEWVVRRQARKLGKG